MREKTKPIATLFPLFFLIFLLLCATFIGVHAQTLASISTSGMIRSQTSSLGFEFSGLSSSDTGWGTPAGGSNAIGAYTNEHHINLMRDAGAKVCRFQLNWWAWETGNTQNVLGIPYPDYIKQLFDWTWAKGMYPVAGMCRSDPSYSPSFPWTLRKAIIEAVPEYSTSWDSNAEGYWLGLQDPQGKWIDWGEDVIRGARPWGIDCMTEATSAVSWTDYRSFVVNCIEAWRAVDSGVQVFVEGYRGGDSYPGASYKSRLDDFIADPLPYSRITYYLHRYAETGGMGNVFFDEFEYGDPAVGRQKLFDYFDWLFHVGEEETLYPNVLIGEWGAYKKEDSRPNNWDLMVQAHFDWAKSRDVPIWQFAFSKATYPMLKNSHTELNDAGGLWAQNLG